mmetsp:Transcript_4204/g.9797  ORF Transcript_4204/g.9797 Transcript_4204/m.9797 type:complete len:226 (+) Transcript_4204:121-798(+)
MVWMSSGVSSKSSPSSSADLGLESQSWWPASNDLRASRASSEALDNLAPGRPGGSLSNQSRTPLGPWSPMPNSQVAAQAVLPTCLLHLSVASPVLPGALQSPRIWCPLCRLAVEVEHTDHWQHHPYPCWRHPQSFDGFAGPLSPQAPPPCRLLLWQRQHLATPEALELHLLLHQDLHFRHFRHFRQFPHLLRSLHQILHRNFQRHLRRPGHLERQRPLSHSRWHH